jgi:hypothetical protein
VLQVTTKWVATLDMAPLAQLCAQYGSKAGGRPPSREAIQALDVALRHGAAMHPSCVAVGRGLFFYDPATVTALGGGCEARPPLHASCLPCACLAPGAARSLRSAATLQRAQGPHDVIAVRRVRSKRRATHQVPQACHQQSTGPLSRPRQAAHPHVPRLLYQYDMGGTMP